MIQSAATRNACISASLAVVFVFPAADALDCPQLLYTQELAGSYNPFGIVANSWLHYQHPVWDKEGMLWDPCKIDLGVHNSWTPADDILLAKVVIEPIAFFDFAVAAGFYAMYNGLGYGLLTFSSPDENYRPEAQDTMATQSASGYWLSLSPTLKAKVWRIVAANNLAVNRTHLDAIGYRLEIRSYGLHKRTDTDIVNTTYLFFEMTKRLLLGLNHRYLHVLGAGARSNRICTMTILTPGVERLQALRLVAMVGGYVRDPVFDGDFYFALSAGADLRIWSRKR